MLCGAGYGEQAGMLNRSLFEDMLIAHWVKRHPEKAAVQLARHEAWVLDRWGEALEVTGLRRAGTVERLRPEERRALDHEFLGKTWTGLTLPKLVNEIRDEWPVQADHRFLDQHARIVNGFNNTLLHHGARSLKLAGEISQDGTVNFSVGPSRTHIKGALSGAFFSYANTMSLVMLGDELEGCQRIYTEHVAAFIHVRDEHESKSAEPDAQAQGKHRGRPHKAHARHSRRV